MKRIVIITSGGDAPGMNACIRAVVRTAISYNIEVYGAYRGYVGLMNGDIEKMESHSVSNIIQKGGTILKSARTEEFKTPEGRKKAYDHLKKLKIEGLIAIGGDGTFAGAQIFGEEFDFPVVGIPGTIDNDIYGTDNTIGYDTAVNTAVDAIDKIRDTADSHGRLFFIEVMGRDSGYIAIRSAIAGGAEAVMLPENRMSPEEVADLLKDKVRSEKTFSIIIVAEKDHPGNSVWLADEVNKILEGKDIRVTILGHIQRGGAPTARDRVLASRLGFSAVEAIRDGHRGVVVGIINKDLAITPISDSIRNKKPLERDLLRMVMTLS